MITSYIQVYLSKHCFIFFAQNLGQLFQSRDILPTLTKLVNKTGKFYLTMMMPRHGNAFCITGPLCGESTGRQLIPLTKDQQYRAWIFFFYYFVGSLNMLLKKIIKPSMAGASWCSCDITKDQIFEFQWYNNAYHIIWYRWDSARKT